MPANEAIYFWTPGKNLPCHAGAAITGKLLVVISANRQSGPGLSATAEGGNYVISQAGAGVKALGVAAHDAAIGTKVSVLRGGVIPVRAGAAIAAFQEVESNANGEVIPKASGVAVGFAMTGAGSGADAEIMFYT